MPKSVKVIQNKKNGSLFHNEVEEIENVLIELKYNPGSHVKLVTKTIVSAPLNFICLN